jgi:hypothetical protein
MTGWMHLALIRLQRQHTAFKPAEGRRRCWIEPYFYYSGNSKCLTAAPSSVKPPSTMYLLMPE